MNKTVNIVSLFAQFSVACSKSLGSGSPLIHCSTKPTTKQELISRWKIERERFHDDILHVEASAYAHWTDFLSMLIYAATNQGRLSTSFIILHCELASAIRWTWFSKVLAANHLCMFAHQTELSEFVLPCADHINMVIKYRKWILKPR